MPSYQIKFGNWATIIEAESETVAQNWANDYRPEDPNTIIEVQVTAKTESEKLAERKDFGQRLVDRYLLTNDAIAKARGEPLTVAESDQQTAKFAGILMILPIGSLRQALEKIQATATDTIYTQDRKDADILALTEFIAAQ